MNEKDGKAGRPPPVESLATVVGVPSLPTHPALDLDMEELSGSVLIEEPPGRGPLMVATSVPSRIPLPAPRLPKPTPPPPKPAASPLPSDASPAPATTAAATATATATPTPTEPPGTTPEQPASEDPTPLLTSDIEVTTMPRSRLEPLLVSLRERLRGTLGRRKWPRKPVVAGAVVVGTLCMAVLLTTASRRPKASVRAASPAVDRVAVTTPPEPAPSATPPPASPAIACTVAGAPRVVAPNAMISAGIEARALGSDIALGFAQSERQATVVRLNASTLSADDSTTIAAPAPIHRVTPVPGKKGRLALSVDVGRRADPLQGRRTLPLDPPLQVGASNSQLVWAYPGAGVGGALWPLDGEGGADALRGARSETDLSSVAIAFRHAGAVWVGTADLKDVLLPRGSVRRLHAPSTNIGSPAVAYSDGLVVVAWAERPSAEDPWRLRWVRFRAGDVPAEPQAFDPPAGGKGQQAMSPALTVVPGGRFLLVWTEGTTSAHDVRALTVSADGVAVGEPLNLSNEGANAGQGQAAIAAGGRGVVAFLEASGGGFQVVARPIACGQ